MNRHLGFSLIEYLVVIAIIALLMAITLPCLARARLQAKIVAANLELRQIGLALNLYMDDHHQQCLPTRKDCSMGWEDRQSPVELAEGGYLPRSDDINKFPVGMEDRFHAGQTYRYWAVGDLVQNGVLSSLLRSTLYVPPGFPDREGRVAEDVRYDDPKTSPVTWVVYSEGPHFDAWTSIKLLHGPVARRSWYRPAKQQGLLTRLRLRHGRQTGSFEMKGLGR